MAICCQGRQSKMLSAITRSTLAGLVVCFGLLSPSSVNAQARIPSVQSQQFRPLHSSNLPPGAVGQQQLLKKLPLQNYYQPFEVRGPKGCRVAVATPDGFLPSTPTSHKAGLLVGNVYRFRITNIPHYEGHEIYPSVEVINRLYPPVGQAWNFPVPVQITQEEIEMALRGQFVTKVVYLEDPKNAFPAQDKKDAQRYYNLGNKEDPLQVADLLGRPMAIIRIGSRTPDVDPTTGRFLFGAPPIMHPPGIEKAKVGRGSYITRRRAVPRDYIPGRPQINVASDPNRTAPFQGARPYQGPGQAGQKALRR